jgi:hypothetical protein
VEIDSGCPETREAVGAFACLTPKFDRKLHSKLLLGTKVARYSASAAELLPPKLGLFLTFHSHSGCLQNPVFLQSLEGSEWLLNSSSGT